MSMQDGGFQFTAPEDGGQGTENPDDVASGFLKGVQNPEHVAVLQQYLPQWQAGVTKRFQSIHDEYRPWKDIGRDPEEVQQALSAWDLLDSNPQRVYELLTEIGQSAGWIPSSQGGQPAPQGQGQPPQPEWMKQVPPEFMQEFQEMKKVLMAIGQETVSSKEARQQADEDAKLDAYLGWLEEQHGKFDERIVLALMQNGLDGPQAVAEYRTMIGQAQGGQNGGGRPTPRVLSGAGSVPMDRQPDYAKASNKDIRADIVARLAASHQQ